MLTYPQWKFRRRLLAGSGIFCACFIAIVAIRALGQVAGSRTVPVVWNIGDAGQQASWLPISNAIDAGSATSIAIPFSTTNGTQGSAYTYFSVVPVTGSIADGYLCMLEGIGPSQVSDAGCVLLDGGVGPYILKSAATPAPLIEFNYTPGSHADGGYIVGTSHTAN